MTWTWLVTDHYVVGTSPGDETLQRFDLSWGPNPAALHFPWPITNYPNLLILSLGFTLSTNAAASGRRPRLAIAQPNGTGTLAYPASVTTLGSTTRRYEFSSGISLDTTLTGGHVREPLPEDLILLGKGTADGNATLAITIDNFSVGDTFLTPLTLTGYLIF